MKPAKIVKLYESLTNQERAALAFKYLAETNEIELDRVEASVPYATYRCRDLDYRERFLRIFDFAALWGLMHWKAQARANALLGAVLVHTHRGADNEADETIDAYHAQQSRLMALEVLLTELSEAHGFDADGVRRIADCLPFEPSHSWIEPDQDYAAELREGFDAVLRCSDERS